MNRVWWIIGAALLVVSVLLREPAIFLISLLLALLAAVSHLWAKYCLVNVSYRRVFESKRLFWGEESELRVEIVNAKLLPLPWLRIDDDVPAALEIAESRANGSFSAGRQRLVHTLSLRWYERVTRRYRIRGVRRGVWSVGPTQLRSGDFFGFDIQRLTLGNREDITVYPRTVPVRGLTLPSGHPVGDARSQQRLLDDPLRLMGVRDYTRSDTFRHIHWKATARRQALQTKVFEPSASQPTAIFLNVDTAVQSANFLSGQDWELAELAIVAAASIARTLWASGHSLGLYANALGARGAQRLHLRPRKHPAQLVRLLEALAHIDGRARWSIEALLQSEAPRLPYGTTLVVISGAITPRLRIALADLRRKGYAIALVTLGAESPPMVADVAHYHVDVGEGDERKTWQTMETLNFVPATTRSEHPPMRTAQPLREN